MSIPAPFIQTHKHTRIHTRTHTSLHTRKHARIYTHSAQETDTHTQTGAARRQIKPFISLKWAVCEARTSGTQGIEFQKIVHLRKRRTLAGMAKALHGLRRVIFRVLISSLAPVSMGRASQSASRFSEFSPPHVSFKSIISFCLF